VTVSNDLDRVRLEARILEALQDRPAAQSVRWAAFETTLDPGILRDYIAKLDDFLEFDELDKAFAAAAANSNAYGALAFFVAWPRRDLAAKRVLDKRTLWEGRHSGCHGAHRALLNDILARAKSLACGHSARYLARLAGLAPSIQDYADLENHTTYVWVSGWRMGERPASGAPSRGTAVYDPFPCSCL
jgi:hypothetical protein